MPKVLTPYDQEKLYKLNGLIIRFDNLIYLLIDVRNELIALGYDEETVNQAMDLRDLVEQDQCKLEEERLRIKTGEW